jgi:hypothetical protein
VNEILVLYFHSVLCLQTDVFIFLALNAVTFAVHGIIADGVTAS